MVFLFGRDCELCPRQGVCAAQTLQFTAKPSVDRWRSAHIAPKMENRANLVPTMPTLFLTEQLTAAQTHLSEHPLLGYSVKTLLFDRLWRKPCPYRGRSAYLNLRQAVECAMRSRLRRLTRANRGTTDTHRWRIARNVLLQLLVLDADEAVIQRRDLVTSLHHF